MAPKELLVGDYARRAIAQINGEKLEPVNLWAKLEGDLALLPADALINLWRDLERKSGVLAADIAAALRHAAPAALRARIEGKLPAPRAAVASRRSVIKGFALGATASEITAAVTCIEVRVQLTLPSVKVSPELASTP